jgi:hypothetical protein
VTSSRFIDVFLCLVIETKLKGIVPVYLFGSDLGNRTWASLNNGTRNILSILVKNTGHANLSSY